MLARTKKWAALAVLGVLVLGGGYCAVVAHEVRSRLAGRRWDVASRVYADVTTLYPGQRMSQALLEARLLKLGYRRVAEPPTRQGELYSRHRQVQVFLRDAALPVLRREGFVATVRFGSRGILAIERRDGGQSEGVLALEPEELMQLFGSSHESRQVISLGDLPHYVADAILAAEDAGFHSHHGVDLAGLARALWVNLRSGEIRQGGSTITQQLAKSYFLSAERTLGRKLREMWVALVLEWSYDKNDILETYLNEIYFGQRGSVSVRGLGEAANFYFGKSARQLSIAEAATLAGLVKAPNSYSPHAHPSRALQRRDQVLRAMHQHGWLDEQELRKAEQTPLTAVGYQAYQRQAPYFVDHVRAELQKRYADEDLRRLGLSVYTTLDTDAQRAAERALHRGLQRLEQRRPALLRDSVDKRLQGAVVVMDVRSGHILAMVGGRDYGESQYNRITQAHRQPGSAFKPFVFLAGLDAYTPASPLSNEPKVYQVDGKRWAPRNYDGITGGAVRMREALGKSINLATVDLAMRVGLDEVVATAARLGISTPLRPQPSLALGASEVVPLELARAYCAFGAGGVLPEPIAVRDVADEQGHLVDRQEASKPRVTSAANAFVLTSMLEEVVDGGTGAALRRWGVHIPVAGKTGTTTDSRDAWFVGYTPEVVALVWVGFDDGTSIQSSGTSAALPIWAELAAAVPWLMSGEEFTQPPGVTVTELCEQSGHRATPGCPQTVQDYLVEGHPAAEPCPEHQQWGVLRGVVHKLKNVLGL